MLSNWQAPRHPCGFLERAHAFGCLQVGCLQSCRHPESGACRPAGTLQAPGRHPAGTRGRLPGACRHRQAASRHPGSGAGCLQAPCTGESIDGVGSSAPVRVTCGPGRAREAFCAEDAEGRREVQAPARRKMNESLNRGRAEDGLEMVTKRRKDPLVLSCYRAPLSVAQDAAALRCVRKERARQR